MGRIKEEFMEEMYNEQYDIEQEYITRKNKDYEEQEFENLTTKEYINQQNQIKMKKVENGNKLVEVKETKKETLRRLFQENNLVEEDVYKDKRGFVIITRTGIDKIVSKQNILVAYEPIVMQKEWVVIRGTATTEVNGKPRNVMSFGEASEDNLMGGAKKFPVAMAEKRAMSRCVLKISGLYEQGVFGQDEIVD